MLYNIIKLTYLLTSVYVTGQCPSVSLSVCLFVSSAAGAPCSRRRALSRKRTAAASRTTARRSAANASECHVYSRCRRLNTDLLLFCFRPHCMHQTDAAYCYRCRTGARGAKMATQIVSRFGGRLAPARAPAERELLRSGESGLLPEYFRLGLVTIKKI